MSDPSKCLTLGRSADAQADDRSVSRAETARAAGNRRLSENTIRLIENWIVGVVTVLSAAVILVTLLAHREGTAPSDPSGQIMMDAGSSPR